MTENTWERTGGLPGFLSTLCALNDGIVPSLHLHGLLPNVTIDFILSTKYQGFLNEVLPKESLAKCDIKLPVNFGKIEMERFSLHTFNTGKTSVGYLFKVIFGIIYFLTIILSLMRKI